MALNFAIGTGNEMRMRIRAQFQVRRLLRFWIARGAETSHRRR